MSYVLSYVYCLFLKKVKSPFLSFSFGKAQENMLSDLADRVTARLFVLSRRGERTHAQMQMGKNLHIYIFFCIFVLEIGIVGEIHIVPFSLNKHT